MNIFDFALRMELDGEKYYRDLAAKAKYDDLKTVLEGLAQDEARHYKIIQSALKGSWKYTGVDNSLSRVPNVFEMSSTSENINLIAKLKDEQIDVYRAALEKEKESVKLYKKLQETVDEVEEKAVCAKLMDEEQKHVEVIDKIIEMLNHVNDWVEAAEFNHHDKF